MTRFAGFGFFGFFSSEEVGEADGGEVRRLLLVGEAEDVGVEGRERVWGLLEPVASKRVEIVDGSHEGGFKKREWVEKRRLKWGLRIG